MTGVVANHPCLQRSGIPKGCQGQQRKAAVFYPLQLSGDSVIQGYVQRRIWLYLYQESVAIMTNSILVLYSVYMFALQELDRQTVG